MNRLLDIGFEAAGNWLTKERKLIFELSRHSTQCNILYAFVSDGEVMYVGKTVQPLQSRMAGYKHPSRTQTTNIKNHAQIKSRLQRGQAVEILALPDNGRMHYGQFHLNLAAGLEDSIIKLLKPAWNGGTPPWQPEIIVDTPKSDPQPVHTFKLILQPTYMRTGFFNVGTSSSSFFGSDKETIEIFCGATERPLLGTINRTANTNQTPRIMGGIGLRDWFKNGYAVKQELAVTVLSPTAIQLI